MTRQKGEGGGEERDGERSRTEELPDDSQAESKSDAVERVWQKAKARLIRDQVYGGRRWK